MASTCQAVTVLRYLLVRVLGHWHVGPRDVLVVDQQMPPASPSEDPGEFPGISRDPGHVIATNTVSSFADPFSLQATAFS